MENILKNQVYQIGRRYSLDKYSHSKILEFNKLLRESDKTIKKFNVNNKYSENDINYIVYAKCTITDNELKIPTRGEECSHSECGNYDDYFRSIVEKG